MKILMDPDYGKALFWDESGCNIGGYECLYIEEKDNEAIVDLSGIKGLKNWFWEWHHESLYLTHHWTDAEWKEWWKRGLKLAKEVKVLIPENVDLLYFPFNNLYGKQDLKNQMMEDFSIMENR